MAIVSGSKRLVKSGQSSGNTSHKFTWKIKTDSVLDTTWTIYTNALCPKKGSAPPLECFPGGVPSGFVALDDADVQPMGDSPFWFEISVEYGIPTFETAENPLDKVERWGGGVSTFFPVLKDIDGVFFKNGLGDVLDPLPERPIAGGQFGLKIRKTNIVPYTNLSHKINSDSIWSLPAYTVKIGEVSWSQGSEGGVKFWDITIPFEYAEDGWRFKFINVGFRGKDGSGKIVAAKNEDGTESALPRPMNDTGVFEAWGTAPTEKTGKLYKEINFAGVGFPNPFTLG